VILLLLITFPSFPQPRATAAWNCRTYSGKGDGAIAIRQSHPLRWFTERLADFDSEVAWRIKHEKGWDRLTAAVSRVGTFHRRDVVDILFRIPDSSNPVAKLVLIGISGQFRPVVWILADGGVAFEPSRVVNVSQVSVLSHRAPMGGTGGFCLEDYFLFDDDAGVPVNLYFDVVIQSELRRLLPPGLGVWKGGGFDIESLHFSHGVWSGNDANCCPSAGKVEIQFAIKGRTAVVVHATYDPASKW
jgi:hypothetical protein